MEAGHCAALAWGHDPGSGEVRFHCSIYDRRPTLCRELGRGSPECEAERERKQTEVLRRVTA
jgi:hypothetical protein